jgi:hypothetical protein
VCVRVCVRACVCVRVFFVVVFLVWVGEGAVLPYLIILAKNHFCSKLKFFYFIYFFFFFCFFFKDWSVI